MWAGFKKTIQKTGTHIHDVRLCSLISFDFNSVSSELRGSDEYQDPAGPVPVLIFNTDAPNKEEKAMRIRMLIAVVVVIILLLIVIALVAGALLLSTGYPPIGENSGLSGMVSSLESLLEEISTGIADWIDYFANHLAG